MGHSEEFYNNVAGIVVIVPLIVGLLVAKYLFLRKLKKRCDSIIGEHVEKSRVLEGYLNVLNDRLHEAGSITPIYFPSAEKSIYGLSKYSVLYVVEDTKCYLGDCDKLKMQFDNKELEYTRFNEKVMLHYRLLTTPELDEFYSRYEIKNSVLDCGEVIKVLVPKT